jgi:hypothetical protein
LVKWYTNIEILSPFLSKHFSGIPNSSLVVLWVFTTLINGNEPCHSDLYKEKRNAEEFVQVVKVRSGF